MDKRLDDLDRVPVEHFERHGTHAPSDHLGDGLAGAVEVPEHGEQCDDRLAPPQQPHPHARDDAEGPLRPDDQPGEIDPGTIGPGGADADQRSARQRDLQAEDVVGRDPVRDRVGAAGVVGDVSADTARGLARGIGRVEVAGLADGARDLDVGDPRFDHRDAVHEIHFEDAVHPGHHDDDAADDRQGAAGHSGPGPAGDHGPWWRAAIRSTCRTSPVEPGSTTRSGTAVKFGGVVLVRQEVTRRRQHVRISHDLAQLARERFA